MSHNVWPIVTIMLGVVALVIALVTGSLVWGIVSAGLIGFSAGWLAHMLATYYFE